MVRKNVVIVGGSISAWILAQMLVPRPEIGKITLLERMDFATGGEEQFGHRKHTHLLSAYGLAELYRLFPLLSSQLDRAGAPTVRWGTTDTIIRLKTGFLTQHQDIGVVTRSMSRTLLERLLRQQVLSSRKVSLVNSVDVVGLLHVDNAVTGVRFTTRRGANVPPEAKANDRKDYSLFADEVVIATGSGDQWAKWFLDASFEIPPQQVVDAGLLYLSADFDGIKLPSKLFATGDKTDRSMVIAKIEGENRYRVTLFIYGYEGEYPESQEQFIELANSISEDGADFLATGTLRKPVQKFVSCESRVFELWEVADWPQHVTVLGDAYMRLNPKFGQGMTLAYIEARELAKQLTGGSALGYVKALEGLTAFSWQLATGGDEAYLRSIGTEGLRPLTMTEKLSQRYFDVLLDLAGSNVNVARAFFQVSNYLVKPTALFAPGIVLAAVKEVLARRFGKKRPG